MKFIDIQLKKICVNLYMRLNVLVNNGTASYRLLYNVTSKLTWTISSTVGFSVCGDTTFLLDSTDLKLSINTLFWKSLFRYTNNLDGDDGQKMKMEPLRETNVGVAHT